MERSTWISAIRISAIGGFEVPMEWFRETLNKLPLLLSAPVRAVLFVIGLIFLAVSGTVFGNLLGITIAIGNRWDDHNQWKETGKWIS